MDLGVSDSAVSKALRGTVVTSVVLIAVSTGPDLIRLVRGRLSGGVFFRNLSVTSSGVAGGVVGGILGGAAGTAIGGPAGGAAGRFVGGMAGSILASKMMSLAIPEADTRGGAQ